MPKARRSSGVNVSFFAFQDIITSVTGILILIVIMLVLMLRQPGAVETPVPEVEKRTLAELESLIEKSIEEIRKFATIDLSTGGETLEEVRAEIGKIRSELDAEEDPVRLALLRDVESAEMERDQAQETLEKLIASIEDAEERLEKGEAILGDRTEFVRENAEQEQVWIKYSDTEKEPIVVELGADGGILRDLRNPEFQKRLPASDIESEVRKLAGASDGAESYFVFFIRPDGIQFLQPLRELLTNEGFDIGYRPLGNQEVLKILGPETLKFEP